MVTGGQPPVLPSRLTLHEQNEVVEFERVELDDSYSSASLALMLIIGFVSVLVVLWLLSR